MKNKKIFKIDSIKNIKKGDQVKVISGKQRGFLGSVKAVINKKSSIILDGMLPRIKYVKDQQPNNKEQQQENLKKKIELPILIHVSNVMLWDKEINKVSRIGYREQIVSLEKVNSEKVKSIENLTVKPIKKRFFKKSGNFLP